MMAWMVEDGYQNHGIIAMPRFSEMMVKRSLIFRHNTNPQGTTRRLPSEGERHQKGGLDLWSLDPLEPPDPLDPLDLLDLLDPLDPTHSCSCHVSS